MKLTPTPFIWFNGELVPWDKAQVHVLTHALHYATSVFEGIRAYATPKGAAVFALDAHVERLYHSCRIVQLPVPYPREVVREAIRAVVRENQLPACYIRPLVYRGYGALGVWPEEAPVEVAIAAFPWIKKNERELYEQGIDVGVSSWRRMAPDTLPAMAKAAGNYLNSALVICEAKRLGFAEAIVLDVDGYVAEGSGQNVFLVHEGRLVTPPIGASILAGVTRACVIALAKELSIDVVEERVPRELLYTASEVFFSGTVAEVTPIRSVDGLVVGSGSRGPVTKALQERFFAVVRGDVEDRRNWLTPVR